MTVRIILADDHPVIRMGVRALLAPRKELALVGEANSPDTLLGLLLTTGADVLVTDYSMPVGHSPDGLKLLGRIRNLYPDLGILVLTMMGNPGILSNILGLGVRGLIDKGSDVGQIAEAIEAVHQKRKYLSTSFRSALFEYSHAEGAVGLDRLSPRELEVLRLFASGMTVTEIAEHFSRSIKTVSTQKSIAMEKLGMKSDRDIFVYARSHGLT